MHLTIRENSKLLRIIESLRRTSRSISATGRKDVAAELDGAEAAILRALNNQRAETLDRDIARSTAA
jgi:hypothetical protein